MSGIAGFFLLDGRMAASEKIRAMHEALVHRGPNGGEVWAHGSAALAHQRLGVPRGPEDVIPKTDRFGRTLTGDLRLDNREELAGLLGVSSEKLAGMGDAELVLFAYEKWGVNCAKKLYGDFAFVIWDEREKRLFCARDPMGVKPFFYTHLPGRIFAFASEPRVLFYLSEVSREWNEEVIADFLIFTNERWPATFFRDIQRLNPAHTAVVTRTGLRLERYWAPEPAHEIHYRDDQEYADAFLEIFKQAVKVRLAGQMPAGAFLSGGLDSSSIVCMARKLLAESGEPDLHTFSAISPSVSQSDESEFIRAVVDQGHLKAHLIRVDQSSPLEGFEELLKQACQPVLAPNYFTHWLIYHEARRQGVHFILDGFGGDTTLFQGTHYFTTLLASGQWKEFLSELNVIHKRTGIPGFNLFRKLVLRPLAPYSLLRAWIFLRHGGRVPQEEVLDLLLNPDFSKQMRLRGKLRERAYQEMKANTSGKALHGYAFEKFAHQISIESSGIAAALCQLEPRYPFLDRRLLEYCLALPPSQKLKHGYTRIVMRRAMQGLLPPKVQWRVCKEYVNYSAYQGLLRFERETMDKCFALEALRGGKYLQSEAVHGLFLQFTLKVRPKYARIIWLVCVLLLWREKIAAFLPTMPQEEKVDPMEKNSEPVPENKKAKTPYVKPEITSFGTVNKITEGVDPGDGEGMTSVPMGS